MDDFLYIIIGIGWLVWTVYTNKKKLDRKREEAERRRALENTTRTQQPYTQSETGELPTPVNRYEPVKPPQNRGKSVLDEIFGEYLPHEEAEPETYIPEIDEKTWQRKMNEYSRNEAESLEEIKEEVQPDYFSKIYSKEYKPVTQDIREEQQHEEERGVNTEIHEDFDIKKAVIYNEILRAPYISERC